MENEVFDVLTKEPWCQTQGDLSANVAKIRATPLETIRDETVRKMKIMTMSDPDDDELLCGLRVLRDAPCTGDTVENAHASNEVAMRDHKQYCAATMLQRGSLHKVRAIFNYNKFEKIKRRCNAKIGVLKKTPARENHRASHVCGGAGQEKEIWSQP